MAPLALGNPKGWAAADSLSSQPDTRDSERQCSLQTHLPRSKMAQQGVVLCEYCLMGIGPFYGCFSLNGYVRVVCANCYWEGTRCCLKQKDWTQKEEQQLPAPVSQSRNSPTIEFQSSQLISASTLVSSTSSVPSNNTSSAVGLTSMNPTAVRVNSQLTRTPPKHGSTSARAGLLSLPTSPPAANHLNALQHPSCLQPSTTPPLLPSSPTADLDLTETNNFSPSTSTSDDVSTTIHLPLSMAAPLLLTSSSTPKNHEPPTACSPYPRNGPKRSLSRPKQVMMASRTYALAALPGTPLPPTVPELSIQGPLQKCASNHLVPLSVIQKAHDSVKGYVAGSLDQPNLNNHLPHIPQALTKSPQQGEQELNLGELPAPESFPPLHDDGSKPSYTYAQLIGMSILRSPARRLTSAQICRWVANTYKFYRDSDSEWRDTIRKHLSSNKGFIKQETSLHYRKYNYWGIQPGREHQFILKAYDIILGEHSKRVLSDEEAIIPIKAKRPRLVPNDNAQENSSLKPTTLSSNKKATDSPLDQRAEAREASPLRSIVMPPEIHASPASAEHWQRNRQEITLPRSELSYIPLQNQPVIIAHRKRGCDKEAIGPNVKKPRLISVQTTLPSETALPLCLSPASPPRTALTRTELSLPKLKPRPDDLQDLMRCTFPRGATMQEVRDLVSCSSPAPLQRCASNHLVPQSVIQKAHDRVKGNELCSQKPLLGVEEEKTSTQEQPKPRYTPSLLRWNGTELLKLYAFIVLGNTEPFFELLEKWTPTHETPARVYLDPPESYNKNQFPCQYPGCHSKQHVFGRRAGLQRHYKSIHASKKESFPCDYSECPRSQDSFTRKDNYKLHLRDFHKEDVGFSGDTDKWKCQEAQIWLGKCKINHKYWRCARCLVKNCVEQVGWECSSCKRPCEEERIQARAPKMPPSRSKEVTSKCPTNDPIPDLGIDPYLSGTPSLSGTLTLSCPTLEHSTSSTAPGTPISGGSDTSKAENESELPSEELPTLAASTAGSLDVQSPDKLRMPSPGQLALTPKDSSLSAMDEALQFTATVPDQRCGSPSQDPRPTRTEILQETTLHQLAMPTIQPIPTNGEKSLTIYPAPPQQSGTHANKMVKPPGRGVFSTIYNNNTPAYDKGLKRGTWVPLEQAKAQRNNVYEKPRITPSELSPPLALKHTTIKPTEACANELVVAARKDTKIIARRLWTTLLDEFENTREKVFELPFDPYPFSVPESELQYTRICEDQCPDEVRLGFEVPPECVCSASRCEEDCWNRASSIECYEKNCGVGSNCGNREISKLKGRPAVELRVIKTPGYGFGLRTKQHLVKNQLIVQYVGEVITEEQFRIRMNHAYVMKLGIPGLYIDAHCYANIGRTMNHSCNPNCRVRKLVINGLPALAFYTVRAIARGEQLTFDYKSRAGFVGKCLCKSENCSALLPNPQSGKQVQRNIKGQHSNDTRNESDGTNVYCICQKPEHGAMIACDNPQCPNKWFHFGCENVGEVPKGNWFCSTCRK